MSQGSPDQNHRVYDLTKLKNKSYQQSALPNRNQSRSNHQEQLLNCYQKHIAKISKILGKKVRERDQSSEERQLQTLTQNLNQLEDALILLKESKVEEVPVMVERIVELERPIVVTRQIEVEIPVQKKVVVEVEKLVPVEKIVEIEKPVFVEKIVEVPVEKPIYIEKEVRVETPIIVERIVEQLCPRCKKNGV